MAYMVDRSKFEYIYPQLNYTNMAFAPDGYDFRNPNFGGSYPFPNYPFPWVNPSLAVGTITRSQSSVIKEPTGKPPRVSGQRSWRVAGDPSVRMKRLRKYEKLKKSEKLPVFIPAITGTSMIYDPLSFHQPFVPLNDDILMENEQKTATKKRKIQLFDDDEENEMVQLKIFIF